jgi:hypothetical protein
MENIEPLPFEVEVIEFIDPLTTFADGVKLRLQTKDKIVFTCNYNYSPFYYKTNWWNRKKLNAEYNKKYREIFFKGKNLIVEATLDETSSDHCVIETAPTSKNLVKEYAELDWEVIGEVKSKVVEEEVLIFCGFSVVAFSNKQLKIGEKYKWQGELRVTESEIKVNM